MGQENRTEALRNEKWVKGGGKRNGTHREDEGHI